VKQANLEDAFGRMLALYALSGRFTLEHLDHPDTNSHYVHNEADRRTANDRALRRGHRKPFSDPQPYRNLAREWIEAHPAQWQDLFMASLQKESIDLDLQQEAA
jgi:hypothetical protein